MQLREIFRRCVGLFFMSLLSVALFFNYGCAIHRDSDDVGGLRWSNSSVLIGGVDVSVRIADNAFERGQGLMNVEDMCDDCGMLFLFQDNKERGFWMKNTLIPLDIIFIDSQEKILNVEEAVPCKEDPCFVYESDGKASYVLEVNGGFCEANGVEKGDSVII